MQQISSKQLKCYGRRNRAKPDVGSLESGPGAGRDVSGATVLAEAVPAAASVEAVEAVVEPAKKPHAGRGRPRKVVGAPKQGETPPSDVASKKVPATRSSVGRAVAPEAREAARDPPAVEASVSEGSSLKPPGQPQDRVPVRVRIVGPFSNGGSKHGRGKSFGSASPGSQKTRGQIARQEAQRAADEDAGDGTQGSERRSEGQAGREGEGPGQAGCGRGMEGNARGERRDAGEQVTGKVDEGQAVRERRVGGKHHRERKEAGDGFVERRDERQAAIEDRVGRVSDIEGRDAAEQCVERRDEGPLGIEEVGGKSDRERDDAAEQVLARRDEGLPVTETRVGGKAHRERKDAGAEAMGRRAGGPSVAEKRVGGKSHRERRDGGNLGQDRQPSATAQGTMASRRRLLAVQKRQREDMALAQADEVLLKHEVRTRYELGLESGQL